MNTAKVIADLRKSRGLSQEEFADMLFVSRHLVSKWENGTRHPDLQTAEQIAKLFGVAPESIIDKNGIVIQELEKCLPDGCTLSDNELTDLLNEFLEELSIIEGDIFGQRYYFLKSIAELAGIFSYKENHVRSTLHRTRKKLTKFIERRQK